MIIHHRSSPRRRTPRGVIAIGSVLALVIACCLVALAGQVTVLIASGPASIASLYQPGPEDGSIPDGEEPSVFDRESPALTRLDPKLLAAVRTAAADAHRDGIDVVLNSGWRSPRFQQWLLDDAIDRHGSRAEALRWVDTPAASQHVLGKEVDIGPYDGAAWFAANGARHDLCQVYANEVWHYELRRGASTHGCPDMYADAAHDPRRRD